MESFHDIFPTTGVGITVVFGLCLLFGVLGGILAGRLRWLPTITAFMLLGVIIGPQGVGLISKTMLRESTIFIDIALGLILYKLGTMLHPWAMLRSRRLMLLALFESLCGFVAVFTAAVLFGTSALVAAMVAAIGVSSSPAVLVHVAEELKAKGPVSDRAKSLVAMNNLLAFFLFSIVLSFSLSGDQNNSLYLAIGLPAYRLAGAILSGVAVAWLATRISGMLREEDEHYRFAIVIGAVMLSTGICVSLGMSSLFSPLILGIATRWFETRGNKLSQVALGEGGDLFFIVLFVMAGAKIKFDELLVLGLLPVFLVLARTVGKMAGIHIAGYLSGVDVRQSFCTGLMLVPMAGMAIGLVMTTSKISPETGAGIATIIFAMVAIFETVGPFLVTYALNASGEAGQRAKNENEEIDDSNL